MLVMQQYLLRHIGTEQALSGLVGSALQTGPELPPFLEQQLIFPYLSGLEFVSALQREGGGTWKLVDLADRVRVPESTEQVLHPEKWVAVESPLPVRLDVELGADWKRTARGTWGEWQTRELLESNGDAAAAGWGGDRYELWQRGACAAAPCRDADVLVMKWRWDTPEDAREFEAAVRASSFASGAAVESSGDTVTVVLAGDAALARRIASANA
jgi:hypothetical protein